MTRSPPYTLGSSEIAEMGEAKPAFFGSLKAAASKAMREAEIAAGRTIVVPGERPWLSKDDWRSDIVVSEDGRYVRIIAIEALSRGNGALSRLVTGICIAGKVPVIIEPMFMMPEILTHWGWFRFRIETPDGFEEQWMPTSRWIAKRCAIAFAESRP